MLDNPTPSDHDLDMDAPPTGMGWSRVKMLSFTCKTCGETFERTEHRAHSVINSGREVSYCSRQCQYGRDSKVEFTCEWCGVEFKRYRSDITKAKSKGSQIRYCSKRCEFEKRGQTNIVKTCEVCGENFTLQASSVKHSADQGWTRRYCSRECSLKGGYQAKRRTRVMVKCLNCGKERERVRWYLTRANYCNQACAMEHRRAKALRKHQKSCMHCGELLVIREGEKVSEFGARATCSKECAMKHGWHVRLRGGKRQSPYPQLWTPRFRLKIRERDGYACQECGVIESGRKHDVHHIDFDKTNCDDFNLILLCHSCHCRTTNSGNQEYWIGRYQAMMRERFEAAA